MALDPDKGRTIVEQQKRGLARLQAAVQEAPGVYPRAHEVPAIRARRVRLCRAIHPEDTYESIAARHPELGDAIQIARQLSVLKRTQLANTFPPKKTISCFRLAQAYLARLPSGYRLPNDD
jgi:hypothetical protein